MVESSLVRFGGESQGLEGAQTIRQTTAQPHLPLATIEKSFTTNTARNQVVGAHAGTVDEVFSCASHVDSVVLYCSHRGVRSTKHFRAQRLTFHVDMLIRR